MILTQETIIRPAKASDKNALAKLIHLSTYVHRHLDWRPPLAWISHPPFLVAEKQNKLVAALGCSPELPEIAWLRVFAHESAISSTAAWNLLWPEALSRLADSNVQVVAAIPIQKWIREILENSGFKGDHNIVTMVWDQRPIIIEPAPKKEYPIRRMTSADIQAVAAIDAAAFAPLWQHTPELIELAFSQAFDATVVEEPSGLIGYQISTPTQYGVHLGRLAVHPRAQGEGTGFALLRDLQTKIAAQNLGRLSVNTQNSNTRSIRLYSKAGFFLTSEAYPVYQFKI